MTCTAAFLSQVNDVDGIINELRASDLTERGSRLDDLRSEAAMKHRKHEGDF